MEGPSSREDPPTLQPLFEPSPLSSTTNEAFPSKPSLLAFPDASKEFFDSPIPPGQKSSPASWKVSVKSPEDYEKDRMGKYALYFQGNTILPSLKSRKFWTPAFSRLSLSRRFAELKKDAFEELMRSAGIPGQYFCRHGFVIGELPGAGANAGGNLH